jgi:hypothetical protein
MMVQVKGDVGLRVFKLRSVAVEQAVEQKV